MSRKDKRKDNQVLLSMLNMRKVDNDDTLDLDMLNELTDSAIELSQRLDKLEVELTLLKSQLGIKESQKEE